MSNTMKNKFGKFLQELFSRGVATGRLNKVFVDYVSPNPT